MRRDWRRLKKNCFRSRDARDAPPTYTRAERPPMPEHAGPRRGYHFRPFSFWISSHMLCFSSAVEAAAHRQPHVGPCRSTPGRWWAKAGRESRGAAAGIGFRLDGDLGEVTRDDTVLLCGGNRRGGDHQAPALVGWLRARGAQGRDHGRALTPRATTLAKAGCSTGKRATHPLEKTRQFHRGIREVTADQVGLRDRRQPASPTQAAPPRST